MRREVVAAAVAKVEARIERCYASRLLRSQCWLYTGARTGDHGSRRGGYGVVRAGGRLVYAHRVMYRFHVGPIRLGREIDHLCGVTSCVRPSHLEAVTHRVNLARGRARATA